LSTLTLELRPSIHDVDAAAWDALLPPDAPPFLEHRFLAALEDSGTLGGDTGWQPALTLLREGDALVGAAPAFVKADSQGEFVFDHAWASFAARLGLRYYPKLLVGVPFTPVTGPRLLVAPGPRAEALRGALAQSLVEVARSLGLSGVHVNFLTEAELPALRGAGFVHRLGVQYHWRRDGATTFDEHLRRFDAKRRNQARRERRAIAEQGIRVETLRGPALREHAALAFRLYVSTVERFAWGRQYLQPRTFELWFERLADVAELALARDAGGEVLAGAVNFRKGARLYGRYWGALAEVKHLHFEVCYHHGIESCVREGTDTFEPGAGGEHKLARGFAPTLTHSMHWLAAPVLAGAVERHLEAERAAVRAAVEAGESD
jgi:predicted N-acyltransferase